MRQPNEEQLKGSLHELGSEETRQGGYDDVVARGRAIGRTRRLAAGAVSASLILALGAWLGVEVLGTGDGAPPHRLVAGAECEVVNDVVPVFPQFSEDDTPYAAPGNVIVIEGDGLYAPASRVDVLWNENGSGASDPDQPKDGASSASRIATGDLENHCSFRVEFSVPDVPAGTYPLTIRVHDPQSNYEITSEFGFRVTG